MTKKQFNKVMNAAPQCTTEAWDKLNLFLDHNPDVAPIIHTYRAALNLVEDIADDDVSNDEITSEQFKGVARKVVADAYNVGSV
jgi:hypothetical protein